MRKEVLPAFRGRKLSSIGKAEIQLLLDKVADRGAPVTANRALAWFKCMCNFSISRGLITVNPCAGIKPLDETPRARVLSDMEIKALWEAASALPPPYRSFVFMLILTGQRRGEVGGMTSAEIDLPGRIWTLSGSRAKNKVEHQIPLSETAVSTLKAIPRTAGCNFVFTANGKGPFKGHHLLKPV